MKAIREAPKTADRLLLLPGGFLLLILLAYRFEKPLFLGEPLELASWDWATLFLLEALFVVALESALLLVRPPGPSPWIRIWMGIAIAVHVMLLAATVVEHQFFVSTGARLTPSVLLYAIQNLGHLLGVVSSAANGHFYLRAVLAVLSLLLSWGLSRRTRQTKSFGFYRWKALGAFGLAALSLSAFPRVATSSVPFSSAEKGWAHPTCLSASPASPRPSLHISSDHSVQPLAAMNRVCPLAALTLRSPSAAASLRDFEIRPGACPPWYRALFPARIRSPWLILFSYRSTAASILRAP